MIEVGNRIDGAVAQLGQKTRLPIIEKAPWKKKIPKSKKRAQTTVEYVILVALVAIIAIKMGEKLKGQIEGMLNDQFQTKSTQALDAMWGP